MFNAPHLTKEEQRDLLMRMVGALAMRYREINFTLDELQNVKGKAYIGIEIKDGKVVGYQLLGGNPN